MIVDRLRGALTALVTPFTKDGEVDTEALERMVRAQLKRGISGFVPCGTTGETPTLSAAEQERVVRTVVEVVDGKVPVLAGTGHNSTKTTADQTKRAKAWGIDAALVVSPFYNKPTQEGMYRHYMQVQEEAGLPIVAYNVPGRTASDLLPETIGRLAKQKAIIGVKDATANMTRTAQTIAAVQDAPFALLSGDDFTILPFVAVGGHGVISVVGNIAPKDTSEMVRATVNGNLAEARALNQRIVPLTQSLFSTTSPVPLKAALAVCGWCNTACRLPLVGADQALMNNMKAALQRYRGGSEGDPLEGFLS